ncbi:hypothetical protein Leryth_026884 [Lithospermum erythrorhizon]|nr:hypothetical protein Leryth_026884 [Lithospermum erythrorhizon]
MATFFESLSLYPSLALILITILVIIFKNFKKPFSSNIPKLPPGPSPWPLVGNIPHIRNMTHISLANLAQIHGPIMSLKLPNKYIIVGSSKEVAIEILKRHDHLLSGRDPPIGHPYTKEELNHISIGWPEECNERWKYLRALCKAELFSGKALASQEYVRQKKTFEMVELIKASEGKVVQVRQIIFATIFNMLSSILLSRDLVSLEEEVEDRKMKGLMRRVTEILMEPNISDIFPALNSLDLQGVHKKGKKLWKEIWDIFEPLVEEKRLRKSKENAEKQDFLDTLVALQFSDDEVQELLVELFSAGSDTSTSTIEWAMAELVKNPEAMKNLQDELEREISQDLIKETHLMQLPYLQACVKETLRLHPAAPLLIPRKPIEACRVMNYTIPKNSQVLVNVWAIGRDQTTWEDPMEFKPERFLNSSLDFKGNDFEFLPFGGGRRICPGYPMAMRQIPLAIASMIHYFNWYLPKGTTPDMLDMSESFGLTLEKEHPLLIIPRARR